MGGHEDGWGMVVAPVVNVEHLDNSVNAVSFGFVATAILISMFLIMAIFERYLPSPSSSSTASSTTPLPRWQCRVLMPGERVVIFIAHPAPAPCPPKRASWPFHQHNQCLLRAKT